MIDAHSQPGHGSVRRTLSRREFLGRAGVLGVTAAATTALPASMAATAAGEDEDLFLLGLEEHFATPELRRLNDIRFPRGPRA